MTLPVFGEQHKMRRNVVEAYSQLLSVQARTEGAEADDGTPIGMVSRADIRTFVNYVRDLEALFAAVVAGNKQSVADALHVLMR